MIAFVSEFFDRFLESGLEFSDLAEEKLREAEQDGRVDRRVCEIVDDFFDIGR